MGRAYPFAPLVTEHSSEGDEADYFSMPERRQSGLHSFLSGGPQVQHQPFVPNTSEQGRGRRQQLAVRPGRSSGDGGENDSGRGESRTNRRGLGYTSGTGGGGGLRDANTMGGAVPSSAGTIRQQGLMGHLVDRNEFQQQMEQMQRRYMGNPARGYFSPAARAITAEGRLDNEASRTPRGEAQQEEEMQSVETSSSSSGGVGSPRGNMDDSRETQLSRPVGEMFCTTETQTDQPMGGFNELLLWKLMVHLSGIIEVIDPDYCCLLTLTLTRKAASDPVGETSFRWHADVDRTVTQGI